MVHLLNLNPVFWSLSKGISLSIYTCISKKTSLNLKLVNFPSWSLHFNFLRINFFMLSFIYSRTSCPQKTNIAVDPSGPVSHREKISAPNGDGNRDQSPNRMGTGSIFIPSPSLLPLFGRYFHPHFSISNWGKNSHLYFFLLDFNWL